MTNQLRVPGASDKFFYYTASGPGATMDVRLNLFFRDEPDVDALKSAFERALTLFPEFSYRPVISQGKIYFQDNNEPVKIINSDRRINLGSDDTNGYLFAIIRDENNSRHLIISLYHGLSDWRGLGSFVRTAIYYYSKKELTPEEIAKSEIRTSKPENWNTPENLDPYNYYGNKDLEPVYIPDMSNYYPLPVKYYDVRETYSRHYRLTLNLGEFLSKSKSLHTSFMPLFISLMFKSVINNYDYGNSNVLLALPVDLRTVFHASSIVNFSDAVFMSLNQKHANLSHEALCSEIKSMINAQRKPENYAKSLFNKAQSVREFESEDIITKSKALTSVIPGGVTYGTSYLGIMDMPGEINSLFDNIFVDAPFAVSYFIITTFRDVINVTSIQRFDDDKLVHALEGEFAKIGIDTQFTDRGRITQNTLNLELLRKAE